jgi:hypothetical protein
MLKRCSLLILMVFFLASCMFHHGDKKRPVPIASLPAKKVTEHRRFSSLSRVEVQGQINVTLHTGYRKPQIVLRGDSRDLAQVKTVVSVNGLLLSLGRGYPQYGQIHVDIQARELNSFTYKGGGLVDGSQLYTRFLDLYLENRGVTKLGGTIGLRRLEVVGKDNFTEISGINSQNLQLYFVGSPRVQLSGVANISNVVINGSVSLSFYWIKSDFLTIRAKNKANIHLAGAVNRLDVELWGNARFMGRFLRAQRSFVKTHGHSVAEISSWNHQSTLATDASDIYYYTLPNTREDFMAYNGSVLDMREWNRMNIRDFDRYNKQFP